MDQWYMVYFWHRRQASITIPYKNTITILYESMTTHRILVVDDEPQITRVLRRGLSPQGFEVQVGEDGEEALTVFQQWKPDLIITMGRGEGLLDPYEVQIPKILRTATRSATWYAL